MHSDKEIFAIARTRVKQRRQKVYQEPRHKPNLVIEITKACISAVLIVGLIVSTLALLSLAAVATRCLITMW